MNGWRGTMRYPRRATEAPLPILAGQVFEHRPSASWQHLIGPALLLAAVLIVVVGIAR